MTTDAIMITAQDNVATDLRDIDAGEEVLIGVGRESSRMVINEHIPYGHKFAVREIAAGQHVLKYGEVMGRATQDIPAGNHAHIQNIESLRGRGDLEVEGE